MAVTQLHPNEQSLTITRETSASARSQYEWADVAFLPVNPTVLPIAQIVARELAKLGLSSTYIWTTHPSEARQQWGNTDISDWKRVALPVQWHANTPTHTVQMLQGMQALRRLDFRRSFGAFVSFIDLGWSPRLFALVCAQQGIPSIFLQEGVTLQQKHAPRLHSARFLAGSVIRKLRERVAPQLFQRSEDGMALEYACVYGALKAESLVANGKPPENIFVTGNPLFDHLNPRPIDPYPRNRTVLYAHQILCEDVTAELEWWKALVAASRRVGARLIFKLHPRGGISAARMRILLDDPAPSDVQFVSEGDIQNMIADAGVFVAACSTSSYRALIDGVPVVQLEGLPTIYHLDLADYGAVLPVYTIDALADTLRAALDEPHTRLQLQPGVDRAIERHLFRLDGGATRRVAQVLAQLVQTRQQEHNDNQS